MSYSWGVFGGLLALSVACGAGCSDSDATGSEAIGEAGNAGSAESGGHGGNAGAGNGAAAGSSGNRESAGSAGEGGTGALGCSQLSIADCATGKNCVVLHATPKTTTPLSEDQAVACANASDCSEVNITARDPQGNEWNFPDTCIPDGWIGEGGLGNN